MIKRTFAILSVFAVLMLFLSCVEEEKKRPVTLAEPHRDKAAPPAMASSSLGPLSSRLQNPVLPHGPSDAWNKFKTDPTVLRDGDVYKMWYSTNKDGSKTVMAYAVSQDGISWKHHPQPVLGLGPSGSWDEADIETPTVIKDEEAPANERYKMWYCAYAADREMYRIGYATSPDGIKWTKYKGNPVLNVGNKEKNEWDAYTVADPMVIKDKGIYKMWYSGAGEVPAERTWHFWIGYATSPDGMTWTKYKNNPVLDIGGKSTFESRGVGQPSVVFDGSTYHLWYSGWDDIDKIWSSEVGYATSKDGINWNKSHKNPIIKKGAEDAWDSSQIVAPTAILEGSEFKIWYTGMKVFRILGFPIDMEIGIGTASVKKENLW